MIGGNGHVHCLVAATGEPVWEKRLDKEFEIKPLSCRPSPLIEDDLLILLTGGAPTACVIALDKDTGNEVWRALDDSVSNSSPIVITAGGKRQLIVWTGESVTSLVPTTGEVIWREPLVTNTTLLEPTSIFFGKLLAWVPPVYANRHVFLRNDKELVCASLAAESLPSEIPEKFEPTYDGFDHVRRKVMIPMRDGVKLHTVILTPKDAHRAPILLTRTPYDADGLTSHAESSHLGPVLNGYDNATDVIVEGGYIRVVQDVRGKHGSEGDYVVNRPLRGPQNPTEVDHSTDTWDTIDWLVKNVPETNGKVGILGISYNGFLPLMALVDPHPALAAAVPMNPMVDGWIGDDWFHNGAFRQLNVSWIYNQVATRKSDSKWWTSHHDVYDMFMQAGSAGELGRRRGLEQLGFWRKLIEHPSYDAFWRDQAVDKVLAARPLSVPVMLVHSLWDQEDIYGAPAVYRALEPKDANNDKVFLVMGPWHHGQEIGDGSSLGAINFNSDTAYYFRSEILRPFLDQCLKDEAPRADLAPVTAFETGTNAWRRLPAWPTGDEGASPIRPTPLYLRAGLNLAFARPEASDIAWDEYISDPAKPVPFRARPNQPMGYGGGLTWSQWLVDDQREASGRPDVLVFTSEVLDKPVKIRGEPVANLVASTSGTDSDWVVKLIDVYPDEVANQPDLGGYQLMIAADIFRGRYRESLETPKAIAANEPLVYRFNLPTANHVFLPGHRIMVQVQSSWFPLYDRNPQTFVPNIFWAKPDDYKKAVQRVYHAPDRESFVELPLAGGM